MSVLKQELIIEPGSTARYFWRDLFSYRELFLVFAWRDISVRYKQTVIGLLWAVIRPFLTMVVFTVIFGSLANLPSEAGAPYAILVFSALLPWNLFSTSLADAGNSLVSNSSFITKVYFPRLIIPAAAIVTALVDFLISLFILFGLMIWYQYVPSWQIVFLPLFTVMAAFAALGPGLYLATMTAKYRDFRIIIPFALQFGLYVSPVGFSASVIPEKWRLLYDLNPLVGVIEGFRWCILGGETPFNWAAFTISAVVIASMTWLGLRQFKGAMSKLADFI